MFSHHRGPHHGHYITIVKSFGSIWRVFDDTNVSTIQESDIPKYFGDSGSGAGYVLFYQAADLVPESLGLPPSPKRVVVDRPNIPLPASPVKLESLPPPLPPSATPASSAPISHASPIPVAATRIEPNGHVPHHHPSAASLAHSQGSGSSPTSGLAPPPIPVSAAAAQDPPPGAVRGRGIETGVPTTVLRLRSVGVAGDAASLDEDAFAEPGLGLELELAKMFSASLSAVRGRFVERDFTSGRTNPPLASE